MDAVLNHFFVRDHFDAIHDNFRLSPESGHAEAQSNWGVIEHRLARVMSNIDAINGKGVLVVLYGGSARREFSAASDLDIAVIGEERDNVQRMEAVIKAFAEYELGIPVEFFPPISLASLETFIFGNPDCYPDFIHGRIVCGSNDLAIAYQHTVDQCLSDEKYRASVCSYYREYASDSLSVKAMLKMIRVAQAFGMEVPYLLLDKLLSAKCADAVGDDDLCAIYRGDKWIRDQIDSLRMRFINHDVPGVAQ